jgi:hypothetical protein
MLNVIPMKRMEPQQNDGWTDVDYNFGQDEERNARISHVLNEACHVFRHHAEGVWASQDKDAYARLLIPEIQAHPSLIGQLNQLDDRVVKMVVYRAVEMMK